MTISAWLRLATNELADNMFESPHLDAEIILAHTIKHPRTWLHAHGEEHLDARTQEIANARLELRKDHVPVAYIIGHKEFYGRRFQVSPAVLIPRPESEEVIAILKQLLPTTAPFPGIESKRLIDIGTGSGCLGITAKLEFPELDVTLSDINRHVKVTALKNARLLNADVSFIVSDILNNYPYKPDIVLANLPYVDESWQRSDELVHEPRNALFADDDGLEFIKRCIDQCQLRQPKGGVLILEADTRQLQAISHYAKSHGFTEVDRSRFAIGFKKD